MKILFILFLFSAIPYHWKNEDIPEGTREGIIVRRSMVDNIAEISEATDVDDGSFIVYADSAKLNQWEIWRIDLVDVTDPENKKVLMIFQPSLEDTRGQDHVAFNIIKKGVKYDVEIWLHSKIKRTLEERDKELETVDKNLNIKFKTDEFFDGVKK